MSQQQSETTYTKLVQIEEEKKIDQPKKPQYK